MGKLPNKKLYRECPKCESMAFGYFDAYCSLCGCKLKDSKKELAGINDYAKSLLILYLINNPKEVKRIHIREIPDYATSEIRNKGNIMFSQTATRHILAECWNEVEPVIEDFWLENKGAEFPSINIEDLHVYAVCRHAEMVWNEISDDFDVCSGYLSKGMILKAVERIKNL